MMKADGGNFFPVDLLALAALNRSANLVLGFTSLIETQNFIAAAPLLRLQIDSCLRFYGVYLVDNPHKFAGAVLKGEQIRKIRDSKGNLMTDRYLVECVAKDFPWIVRVYERTSGYIHLSRVHIASIFGESTKEELEERIAKIAIGPKGEFAKPEHYEEAVSAFIAATEALFHYVIGWVKTKERKPNG